jgi:hypothetical protein
MLVKQIQSKGRVGDDVRSGQSSFSPFPSWCWISLWQHRLIGSLKTTCFHTDSEGEDEHED